MSNKDLLHLRYLMQELATIENEYYTEQRNKNKVKIYSHDGNYAFLLSGNTCETKIIFNYMIGGDNAENGY